MLLQTIVTWIADRLEAEDGVTAIEYGLIAALIAVFIIGALQAVGGALDGIFQQVAAALN